MGISPQFSDGTPAPPTSNNNTGLTLGQLQSQVDADKKIIAQQMSADAALSTNPPDTQIGSIFGFTVCVSRCYGAAFTITSDGGAARSSTRGPFDSLRPRRVCVKGFAEQKKTSVPQESNLGKNASRYYTVHSGPWV